jgi:hypothetical protein
VTIKTRHNDELDAVVTVLVQLKTPKTILFRKNQEMKI